MLNINKELSDVRVGPATVFAGLAVIPLIRKNPATRDYLTLSEAFSRGGVEVTEVSEGGNVPELKLKNTLDKDVFAADGETLLGAKQNRVLNTSIFVKAKSEIVVPVSCVEHGRWSYNSRQFRDSDYSELYQSRAVKMESVSASLKTGTGGRYSDQGAVWDRVDAKRREFGAHAPTGSMADIYESRRSTLDEYVSSFRARPDQAGVAFAINGEVTGIELFEQADVLEQYLGKLVRAYASEVIGKEHRATLVPDRADLRDLLNKVSKADVDEYPAVGSGRELRFSTGRLNGSALEVDGRLLHLVLLRKSDVRRVHN